MFLGLLWWSSVIASEEKLWKHEGNNLTPQCFVYELISGDNLEEFYERYSPAIIKEYAREKYNKIQNTIFIFSSLGKFFPKFIPVGEKFEASWGDTLSLTTYLKDCAKSDYTEIDKSKNFYEIVDDEKIQSTWSFKNKCSGYSPGLISISKAKCLDIKTIAYTEVFTEGTMAPVSQYNTYGIYELDGEKIILPLRFNEKLVQNKKDNTKSAGEKLTYDWFKVNNKFDNVFDNVNQLIHKKNFVNFIEDNISSKKLSLGMSKGKKVPLIDSFYSVLGGPPGMVIYSDNNRYIFTSGCRPHSCGEKGVLFIDTQEKLTIGLIRHSILDDSEWDGKYDFLIFSKNHKSFEEIPRVFIEKVKEWVFTSRANKPPKVVRFIGADDKIIDVTKKYEELILLSQRPILKCSYVVAGETKSVVHDFNRFDAYPVYEMTNSEIKWEYPQLQNEVQFIVKSKFNRTTGLIETEVTQKGESKGTIISGMCDKEVVQ